MLAVYQIIGLVFLFLIIATVIGYALAPNAQLADLKPRIRSWWIIIPVFSAGLILNGPYFYLLLCFISFMGLKEFISVIPTRPSDRLLILIAYTLIPIQFYLAWRHHTLFTEFIPIVGFISLAVVATLLGVTKGLLKSVGTLFWGLMLIVYSLSFLAYLNTITPALVLYLVVILQLNDVSQYCFGKYFGGRKITPNVSPNKTLSGLLGGIATSMLLSLLLGKILLSMSVLPALLLGVALSLCGFIGDILISAIKRDINIKDFSALIPAHGGMLDRIDSLLLAGPLIYFWMPS